LERGIRPAQFAHPFCVSPLGGGAEGKRVRRVVKRKIGETRQCLERLPSVETDSSVWIVERVNEIRIKPIATGCLLRRLPTHSPSDQCALSRVAFNEPLHAG